MRIKGFWIVLFAILLSTSAFAQVNESQCTSCTNGYAIALTGDVNIAGTLRTVGATTQLGTTTSSGLITSSAGITAGTFTSVTDTTTLTSASCGVPISVTAGIDTKTITLPSAASVPGCVYTIHYVGADAGALVDISPNDAVADGIEGGCTLAASVVTFSGTADADIGLTKATGLTGDTITLTACGSAMWCVSACQGIWANN